ncbi:E3 ubiquitin-protein ligase NEDD4 [Capsaspora owczarzaki ATCC 30864]|uniref:HECT-type E3 ubiquitin transferase n=2 Tax=Capsaspora owczarzaki (strain ATCC 30864) TaxID=595528 RepID=A0A0D2VSH0_CAPO3|nr:E3 ubiquitin-protein ligase NEDD4 [Capsaspora owczarzaki ATCC 30864]
MRRDFNAKQRKIRSSLQASPGECHLKVHRASLFQSSEREVMKRPTKILKKHLFVHFDDEGGLDYGGLAREWIFLLSHEMFNPFYGLFEYSSETNYTLQINPNSITNPDCLRHFEFVGRMVGLATFHRHFIDAAFVSTFYKQLLRRPLQLGDLQHVDPELHRSMIWILENDVTDVIDQTFTVDVDKFGMTVTQELIPNGAQIQVTEDNKKRFVDAMAQWRFFRGTERQMRAFMTGFYEFVPLEEIRHLDESELEFLISGLRQLDIEDWENHTDYTGYDKTDEQVIWFWKCLREMDAEKQAKLLQFVTGTSRVPLEGFRALQGTDRARPFWIQRIHDVSRLPSSHTCFNRLDLPAYSSFEILRSKLLAAVEGSQGFTNE